MKTTITIAALLFFSIILSAQQKLQLGSFRCFSFVGPLMDYWNNPLTVKLFSQKLDSTLYAHTGYRMDNPDRIAFQQFDTKDLSSGILFTPAINQPSISIFMIEYHPNNLFKPSNTKEENAYLFTLTSCIRIGLLITDNNKKIKINKEIDVYLKRGENNGIGLLVSNLVVSSKGFLALFDQILPRLLNDKDSLQNVEMKVSGVFAADNFLLTANMGKPRIQIEIKKDAAAFEVNGESQLLRWSPPTYQEIIESGKNKTRISDSISVAIKRERKSAHAVFIYLKQSLRDAVHNKNYEVIMPAQFWYEATTFEVGLNSLSVIAGEHHKIIADNDTVGYFSVVRGGGDSSKKFSLHKISNGFDTASITQISATPLTFPVVYDYQIKGIINGHSFSVFIYGKQYIREIWIDGLLTTTLFGEISPSKMLLATEINNIPLLNLLILFSYQAYFSSTTLSRYTGGKPLKFSDYFPTFGSVKSYSLMQNQRLL